MIRMKLNIYDFSQEQLMEWLEKIHEKPYRAKQIWDFLYRQQVINFDAMHNLSGKLQQQLLETFTLDILEQTVVQKSTDGTIKFLFRLADGNLIETVLMRHDYGNSVCVTTQVGCNIGCSFCASGLLKKTRDLSAGEIIAQIIKVQQYFNETESGERVSHIVVMGIGEPFDNYQELMRFIRTVNDAKGLAIGARHITVSTSGIVPKIYEFAEEGIQINLALSLHAPNNTLRNKLMKINKTYNIEQLMDAIYTYIDKTNRRVTFEYIMIERLNDQIHHAQELVELILPAYRHLIYINLIPYNPVNEHIDYKRSKKESILAFYHELKKNKINTIIRHEQGSDIDAACGQLRSQQIKKGAN